MDILFSFVLAVYFSLCLHEGKYVFIIIIIIIIIIILLLVWILFYIDVK
jgi:hypothetical protein